MQLVSLLNHIGELSRIIYKSPGPSDKTASEYLRSKKYIGSKERKFISEITFSYLRQYKTINLILKQDSNLFETIHPAGAVTLLILDLLQNKEESQGFNLFNYIGSADLSQFLSQLCDYADKSEANGKQLADNALIDYEGLCNKAEFIKHQGKPQAEELEFLASFYSTQSWLLEEIGLKPYSRYNLETACDIFEAAKKPAPLTIRIDEAKMSRNQAISYFRTYDVESEATKIAKTGLTIKRRINFNDYEIFNSGSAEAQDEGSQLISLALYPDERSKVLDACAGAGGKSLHIASLQNDKGKITACDINPAKLREAAKRAGRAGYSSIETIVSSNLKKRANMRFDYTLVDAPCSGLGTIRRMPMTKYRLNPKLLERLSAKQLEILEDYSKFVKDGGVLVYSTCSLTPQENDLVAEKFLEKNPSFTSDALPEELNMVKSSPEDYSIQLNPFNHNTDGFFMARFRRIG